MHDLTGFQRDMLYIIAGLESGDQKNHGLGIKRQLEEYYQTEIHHGRLYPNLDELVTKGLVKKGEIDRRTNSYTITRRGSGEIAERRRWEDEFLGDTDLDEHGVTPRMRQE